MQLLTKGQRALLVAIGKSELQSHIYFSGGTLLAAYYLQHRKSFDLDFFSDTFLDDLFVSRGIKEISIAIGATDVRYTRFLSRSQYFFKKESRRFLNKRFK